MGYRPWNETPEDLANEKEAGEIISAAWNVEICKLQTQSYRVDWALSRDGKVQAFAEFKQRKRKYDPFSISAAKYIQLSELRRTTGHKTFIIVRWPDGEIGYHEVGKTPMQLPLNLDVWGNSRGQPGDIEPMISIPLSEFKTLKTS